MIKVGTFCSGIGSPEEALKELEVEHEVVFACERDKYAKQTYLANHRANQMFDDMTTMDMGQEGLYSDVVIAGIPCQSFSLAGKRLGELDPRGLLFYNFYDYVQKQQPKYFIIENVKGLLSTGTVFANWLELLGQSVNNQYNMINHEDSLMYNIHWTVLNSKDFGVPQNRERVFIIGIRNDLPNNFRFPIGFPLTKRLKDILEPVVDEKYYLSDKMLNGFMNKGGDFGERFSPKCEEDVASCITARLAKMAVTDNYIKEGFINQDTQASAENTAEGISPTVSAGTHGYALGYITEPQMLGSANGLVKTIRTGGHGSLTTKHALDVVIEPLCVAQRGRNPSNSSDRTTGAPTEQRLEPNSQGITNTITSVQKDNLIVEPKIIGYTRDSKGKVTDRHLKDETGTIHIITGSGGNTDQFILTNELITVGNIESAFESNGRVYSDEGISKTINAGNGGGGETGQRTGIYQTQNRIRRLTPRECMRLMGFSDDFKQPVSDSQKYRQAGNSIVTNVIGAILKNLLNL